MTTEDPIRLSAKGRAFLEGTDVPPEKRLLYTIISLCSDGVTPSNAKGLCAEMLKKYGSAAAALDALVAGDAVLVPDKTQ